MSKNLNIVIAGRVNVGKSTLFNRILGKKKALVSEIPRVTRDRNETTVTRFGTNFNLIDTGGYEGSNGDIISKKIIEQMREAIKTCDKVLFVVDAKSGIHPLDKEILSDLKKLKKGVSDILLVINKVDDEEKHEDRVHDFHALGFKKYYSVSAETGRGVDEIIEEILPPDSPILEEISEEAGGEEEENKPTKEFKMKEVPFIAIVGKPNVGKSSFINKILNENRLIVDEKAGTTRDPIDVNVRASGHEFVFIDTAGMRKKARVEESVEKLSTLMAERSIERADFIIHMIDGTFEASEQDMRIAEITKNNGKPMLLVVNKSDLVREMGLTKNDIKEIVRRRIKFLSHVPVHFISVKTGEGISLLFKKIFEVYNEYFHRISTSELNKFYENVIERHSLPMRSGRNVKIYYITQVKVAPPEFILFSNYPNDIEDSYKKYIENKLREEFGFLGVPLRLVFREKKG